MVRRSLLFLLGLTVLSAVVAALGAVRPPRPGGAAAAGASVPDEPVRGAAIDVATPSGLRAWVARCRKPASADLRVFRAEALHDADPLVAGNAIAALGRLGAVWGDDELLELLDDPRPRVRQQLIVALSQCGDADALPWLERAASRAPDCAGLAQWASATLRASLTGAGAR
ncbi:MAG: HEAT repeat domain-containing protein [Planctomycetes bacterium]|nr:HEAT repeat domain-containing protein [Planctomycetota bacterium]